MKKTLIQALVIALLASLAGCFSLVEVEKESPASFSRKGVKQIYVGWLDIPESLWKTLGYASKHNWITEVRGNNDGIKTYLREYLPNRNIKGSMTKPASGDIFISFKYFDFVQKYNAWSGGMDEMKIGVEITEITSGKSIYKSVLIVKSGGSFPRNWKASTLDGRLDNIMYNLAGFIAGKL
jgi:hypothetical protein